MNIKFIFFLGICLIILFTVFFDLIYRFVILKHFYNSYSWVCNKSNFLIAISGAIRKGKTTLMFGLAHLFSLKRRNDLYEKMLEIETILIDLNFTKVKFKFQNLLEENGFDYFKSLALFLSDYRINESSYFLNLNNFFYDHLKSTENLKLLVDYLYYLYHSLRVYYVNSNVQFFNQISSVYSLQYDGEWIKLKNTDEMKNHDFPLEEHSIFLYDEQLLDNKNDNDSKRRNEDNGSDIFYRLFGQIFRESSYFLTTLQNAKRWVKFEREIVQQHIYVNDRLFINSYPVKQFLLNLFERIIDFIYSVVSWFLLKIKKTRYIEENNIFKKIKRRIKLANKKIISKSFVIFKTSIYTDIEQVGKFIKDDEQNESAYNFNFYLPVQYVWDVGNTHLYHVLYDYLHKRSNLKPSMVDLTELDFEDIKNMLVKYNDKEQSKNSDFNSLIDENFYK